MVARRRKVLFIAKENGPRSTPCSCGSSAWASASWCSTSTRRCRDRRRRSRAGAAGPPWHCAGPPPPRRTRRRLRRRAGPTGGGGCGGTRAARCAGSRGRGGCRPLGAVGAAGASPACAGRRPAARSRSDHGRLRPQQSQRRATRVRSRLSSSRCGPAASPCIPTPLPALAPRAEAGAAVSLAALSVSAQDAAEAGWPAASEPASKGTRSPPHLCQFSGTTAALFAVFGPPPRSGEPRPVASASGAPHAARGSEGAGGRPALSQGHARDLAATAAALHRVARLGLALARRPTRKPNGRSSPRSAALTSRRPGRQGPRAASPRWRRKRNCQVAATPAAQAQPAARGPRPRPAAGRAGAGNEGHPRRARGRVRLHVIHADPGPHPDRRPRLRRRTPAWPVSTRSPKDVSALRDGGHLAAEPRPGAQRVGPGSCRKPVDKTSCEPG